MKAYILAFMLALAGCASTTHPAEPLSAQRQAAGYELQDGTTVEWGRVDTDGAGDWSDRSTAR